MLGHGSSDGLLNLGQFPETSSYIIDELMVSPLKWKTNSLFIWCFADHFVRRHGLSGFSTGMFVSEVREAREYCFHNVNSAMIEESNLRFAGILARFINEPVEVMYNKLVQEYEILARTNMVARFNLESLYLTQQEATNNSYRDFVFEK